jgi:hypothetical protein
MTQENGNRNKQRQNQKPKVNDRQITRKIEEEKFSILLPLLTLVSWLNYRNNQRKNEFQKSEQGAPLNSSQNAHFFQMEDWTFILNLELSHR